jgi:hypothetical protein
MSRCLLALLVLGASVACSSLDHYEIEAPVAGMGDLGAEEGIDLLVVHGMGGFAPGNPEPILRAVAESRAWTEALEPEDEHLEEGERYYGRIRRHEWSDAAGVPRGRAVVFYWTGTTQRAKELYLGDDLDAEAEARREPLNHALKRDFIVKKVPDLALYLGRHRAAIHRGLRRAFESIVEKDSGRPLAIVTYSLAARIVIDLLASLVESPRLEDRELGAAVFDRLGYMGCLSNQIALLEMLDFEYEAVSSDPEAALQPVLSPALRRFDQELRQRELERGSAPLAIVAISDPNDLLSFGIPPWLHAALPGRFVNAWISVARTSFWIPFLATFARPDTAHRDYALVPEVRRLLIEGERVRVTPPPPADRGEAGRTEALPARP